MDVPPRHHHPSQDHQGFATPGREAEWRQGPRPLLSQPRTPTRQSRVCTARPLGRGVRKRLGLIPDRGPQSSTGSCRAPATSATHSRKTAEAKSNCYRGGPQSQGLGALHTSAHRGMAGGAGPPVPKDPHGTDPLFRPSRAPRRQEAGRRASSTERPGLRKNFAAHGVRRRWRAGEVSGQTNSLPAYQVPPRKHFLKLSRGHSGRPLPVPRGGPA